MKKKFILAAFVIIVAATLFAADLMNNAVRVATVDGRIRYTSLAMGAEGIVHVCFLEDTNGSGDVVYYASYDGTTASAKFLVCDSMLTRANQPSIGISPKGLVGIVWGIYSENSVYMRLYDSVAKQWRPIEKVSNDFGADEPSIVIDDQENIHVFFFSDGRGASYARSKINGVWEPEFRLSNPSTRSTQGGIAMGPDGKAWVFWRERECSGGWCEYKPFYRQRAKGSPWSGAKKVTEGGASKSHPSIAVGPDGIPWLAWADVDDSEVPEIWVCKLNESDNPRQKAIPIGRSMHYPRIAIDANLKVHVSTQLGAGDMGDGIYYTNNMTGNWAVPQTMEGGWTKCAGIGADGWGNVAVSWSAVLDTRAEVWINSLQPISPKYFYGPVDLRISISLTSVRKAPKTIYHLSWNPNPQNQNQYIKGYNIYVKEDGGAYQLLTQLSKSSLNTELTYDDSSKKRQFALATVSIAGMVSEIVEF